MNSLLNLVSLLVLEQAAETDQVLPIDVMWEHITSLDVVEAVTFMSFGMVCLLYGWRVFKILVTICFGLFGLFVGIWANEQLVGGDVIWLALILVVFFAVLSVPFMRWGVTLLGAMSGGVLTAGLWLAAGLNPELIWAGGLVGVVAGGMISFIVFKIAVILFTSLGGSSLVVVGALAVLYRYLLDGEELKAFVYENQWFLPVVLLGPMAVGIFLQYRSVKAAGDWAG